jgi:hypothetical protein
MAPNTYQSETWLPPGWAQHPKGVIRSTIAYLAKGSALEYVQEMAAHASPRATKLYDRTKERLTQDEVERIRL